MRKRSRAQRERDLPLILEMHIRGHSAESIAESLSIERPYRIAWRQIWRDIADAKRRWQEEVAERIRLVTATELAKIDHLERQYWRIFEENVAIQPEEGSFTFQANAFLGTRTKVSSDFRIGALKGVQWCIDRRIKLLGIVAPLECEHGVAIADVNASIHAMAHEMRKRMGPPPSDDLEE